MAVGSYVHTGVRKALAERWDGSGWSLQSPPNPEASKATSLLDVSCTSSSSCTAVGRYVTASAYAEAGISEEKTLAENWDGSEWAIQPTPNPEGHNLPRLSGVSCTGASACIAVGWAKQGLSEDETMTLGARYGSAD